MFACIGWCVSHTPVHKPGRCIEEWSRPLDCRMDCNHNQVNMHRVTYIEHTHTHTHTHTKTHIDGTHRHTQQGTQKETHGHSLQWRDLWIVVWIFIIQGNTHTQSMQMHRDMHTDTQTRGHSSSVHGNGWVEWGQTRELHRGMVELWIVGWIFITHRLIHMHRITHIQKACKCIHTVTHTNQHTDLHKITQT